MKNLLKGLLIMLSISLGTMTLMFTKANEEPIDPEEGKVETEDVSPRDIYIGNTFIDEEGNVVIEEEQAEMPVSKTRSTKAISYPGFLDLRALSTSKTIKLYTSSTSNTGYAVFNPGSANIIPVYSKSNNRYKVNVNGRIGWMSASSGIVELTPSQLISKKYDSYFINTSKGDLAYSYMYYGKRSSFIVGEKLSFLTTGVKYYSTDGIYFYDSVSKMLAGNTNSAVNKGTPYYNYYQYLPIRSASKLTASDFIKFLNSKGYTSSNSVMATSSAANAFIKAQGSYGINAAIEFSMGILESGYGTSSLAKNKNNLFGWGAVDNNPTNGAFKFSSVAAGIDYHANNGMSAGYLDTKYDYRYFGANLGNKNNGLNVKYASDPYWGMKIAGIYYKVDQYSGFKDKDFYQIGIKTSSEDPMIYYGSNPVYRFKNNKVNLKITNMPFVVLKNEGKGKYKFLSDSPIYNSGDALKYQKISGSTIYWRICSQIPSCASIKVGDAYFASTYRFNQDIVTSTFNSVKLIGSNVPRNPNDKINDGDNDGVIDGKDKCPSTPVGTNVNADGCAFGSEYNAVINATNKTVSALSGAANKSVLAIINPKAVDFDGSDLTSEIIVVSDGDYDYRVEGSYDVSFSVTGENGIKVTKQVKIIVGPEADNDKDGVGNSKDKCPSTPEGTTVDANGCAFGSEYNAVINATNKTVSALSGAANKSVLAIINPKAVDFDGSDLTSEIIVVRDGNYDYRVEGSYDVSFSVTGENGIKVTKQVQITVGPEADNDKDGVGNSKDKCPSTPEGTTVDANGCAFGSEYNAVINATNKTVSALSSAANKSVLAIINPKAVDFDGSDLTSEITVVSDGDYDYRVEGSYDVSFGVTGENGIKVTKQVQIIVGPEADNDKDGVGNSKDKCPSTPEGTTVDANGCAFGSEYNAVINVNSLEVQVYSEQANRNVKSILSPTAVDFDGKDLTSKIVVVSDGGYDYKVEGTYKVKFSVVGENGIVVEKVVGLITTPEPDNDKDGVVDRLDKCPSTPEGTTVDANGCAFGSEYNATIEATDKQVQATTPAARKDVLGIINPTAVDFDGRDISNLVKIANDGNYNSEVAGMYKITLSVIGENGITVNKINYIMVTPEPDNDNDGIGNSIDQCPNTSEEYVENVDETGCVSGEKFNALIGVTLVEVTANSTLAKKDVMTILDPRAFDYDGRDITSKIVLVSNGGYDYSKMGEYTVTFAVTGENRIKVETKVVIKVLSEIDDDKDGVGNSLDKCPSTQEGFEVSSDGCVTGEKYNAILTASDKVVLENSSASKMDVLSIINAKAEDYDGSDLTGEIKLVNSGEYKSSVPGTYVITVSVTGENKIAVTKNFKITVERDYSNNASKIVEEYVKNSNSEEFRSRNVVDETKETFEMLMEIQKSTSFENFLEITQLFKTR